MGGLQPVDGFLSNSDGASLAITYPLLDILANILISAGLSTPES